MASLYIEVMKTPILATSALLALLILTSSGCLQHTYRFRLLPDKRLYIDYEARGDRIDIEDGFDVFPDSATWNITRSIEEKEDETIHILAASYAVDKLPELNSVMQWEKTADETLQVHRSFNLVREEQLFGKAYYFRGEFQSRRFVEIYGDIWDFIPEECRILDNDQALEELPQEEIDLLRRKFSLGVLQWNLRRYEKRFIRTWEILKLRVSDLPDTSLPVFSIAYAGWSDDLRRYLNRLDIEDPNTINLEWWDDLRPMFTGRLIDVSGIVNADLIGRIGDALEKSYQISKDLKDDVYHVSVMLPGKIMHTNGTAEEDNTIKWELNGEDIMDETEYLEASTFVLSIWRIVIVAFLVLIAVKLLKNLVQKLLTKKSA